MVDERETNEKPGKPWTNRVSSELSCLFLFDVFCILILSFKQPSTPVLHQCRRVDVFFGGVSTEDLLVAPKLVVFVGDETNHTSVLFISKTLDVHWCTFCIGGL